MPVTGGGGDGSGGVRRPTALAGSPRWRLGGRVWMPRLPGPLNLGLLAPTTVTRVRKRQTCQPAVGSVFTAPPPPPPPPPPVVTFGVLAPTESVRGVRWQKWRSAAGGPPAVAFCFSALRPITSSRPRPAGRVLIGRGAPTDTLRTPLRGLTVSIRHRWKAGKAATPRALPPSNPIFSPRVGLLVSSPRRLRPGRVIAPRFLSVPALGLRISILRPIASPRRLIPGRASVSRGAPTPTLLTPLRAPLISRPSPRPPGRVSIGRIFPPQPTSGLLWPTNPVRVRQRQRWWGAIGGSGPPTVLALISSGVRPIASPRRLRPGTARTARALPPPNAPGTILRGLVVRRHIPWRPGRVSPWRGLKDQTGPVSGTGGSSVLRPIGSGRRAPPRARWVWSARPVPPPTPISRFAGPLLIQLRGDQLRRRRTGWMLQFIPIPLGGPVVGLGYHVYGNAGNGPINYVAPLATVYGLTWTSGALSYASDWKFGVRAFNGYGEEQNLDAAVELILDSNGVDITNRPEPPTGLRALAQAGGAVRVEWAYPSIKRATLPTGFHVYIGTGGAVSYITPTKTVLYSTGIAGTFGVTLTGLTDDMIYAIGVRSYNATAEEPNTFAVSVTADSTGPLPVDSLTGTAV